MEIQVFILSVKFHSVFLVLVTRACQLLTVFFEYLLRLDFCL